MSRRTNDHALWMDSMDSTINTNCSDTNWQGIVIHATYIVAHDVNAKIRKVV